MLQTDVCRRSLAARAHLQHNAYRVVLATQKSSELSGIDLLKGTIDASEIPVTLLSSDSIHF